MAKLTLFGGKVFKPTMMLERKKTEEIRVFINFLSQINKRCEFLLRQIHSNCAYSLFGSYLKAQFYCDQELFLFWLTSELLLLVV